MSGHSKWSTIKRKKGALDAKRGKIFTRCIKEISVAVNQGGSGDPDANPRLRLAIDKARAANMPNDNINRAIKRATGEEGGDKQEEVRYEGYGPSGTAILVETVTDNRNRTVSEIRHAFSRAGGNLGENGCVSYLFQQKGLLVVEKDSIAEDDLMEIVLTNGAEDISAEAEVWEVTAEPSDFFKLKEVLEPKAKLVLAEIQMLPSSRITLVDKDLESFQKLIETLEEIDDVLDVFTNADFVEE